VAISGVDLAIVHRVGVITPVLVTDASTIGVTVRVFAASVAVERIVIDIAAALNTTAWVTGLL